MFVSEVQFYYCYIQIIDASGLVSVKSVKLFFGVKVTTLSALSAIFIGTTIVDLTLDVENLETVSEI